MNRATVCLAFVVACGVDDHSGRPGADSPPDADPTLAPDPAAWTAQCPALESTGVDLSRSGACSAPPMESELTQDQADAILDRVLHEAGHLAEELTGEGTGGLAEPGTDFPGELQGILDNGWFRAAVGDVRIGASDATCFTVEFACWSGGHGGWGLSALEGEAFVAVTTEDGVTTLHVVGDLGLVDASPFSGAPTSFVDVRAEGTSNPGATAEGRVGQFEY